MQTLLLREARRAAGRMRLPGSKSISNRMLLLAALARGRTGLRGVLESDDTRVMRDALDALGVGLTMRGDEEMIEGVGGPMGFRVKKASLFLGNAGTAFRPLTAALALADGHYELSGVARMHERPIADLVDALRQAGARVDYRGNEGFPPLAIAPHESRGMATVRVRGNVSSQYLTALLIALGSTRRGARIEVDGELISKPYVEMTLRLMERFGVRVQRDGWRAFEIPPGEGFVSPGTLDVEGDASSASYFLAAGLLGGGPVRVEGVGSTSLQGDVAFAQVLGQLGAAIAMGETWIESRGSPPVRAFDLDFNMIPDAAMTAAVLALFADGPSRLRNIASWRVKETDRIAAMATELRKFGAEVEEGADYLAITPPMSFRQPPSAHRLPLVTVDTYDDHRMAMCFSLASFGPHPVRINDPGCVSKTFPAYFEEFARLVTP